MIICPNSSLVSQERYRLRQDTELNTEDGERAPSETDLLAQTCETGCQCAAQLVTERAHCVQVLRVPEGPGLHLREGEASGRGHPPPEEEKSNMPAEGGGGRRGDTRGLSGSSPYTGENTR